MLKKLALVLALAASAYLPRAQEFIKNFDRMVDNNTLPQFISVYQPNDHTASV